jgi:predicted transcriptional regulator
MKMKLFDAELRIMKILWENGEKTARQLATILGEQVGWSITTTYTMIKRCVEKGAIKRTEPNFMCSAIVTKEEAQEYATSVLINKMYSGSADRLVASLLGGKLLSKEEVERLKQYVKELE